MKQKFFDCVIRFRIPIMVIFVLAAVWGAYAKQLVQVNYDMNDYLPEESSSTVSMDKMQEEFDGGIPNARVAVKDVSYAQALKYKEKLEKDGEGLNLTWEVRDGILNHQTRTIPHTLEGKIVRLSDKIAYVNSDIDDAIRAMILDEEDIPVELRRTLGFTTRERLDHLIHDIISNSMGRDDIIMSDETAEALRDLRLFMFEHVYRNPVAKGEEVKAKAMLEQMYYFYMDHIEQLPAKLLKMLDEGEDKGRIVCDYISGMTDKYAITKFKENFMPQAWKVDGY